MKTSDVYLASALLASGYKLGNVNRSDPRHMVFEFFLPAPSENLGQVGYAVNQQNLDQLETQWANRTLIVNAFDYSEAIKRMKSLIHSS
jgi:hypothetical protein